MKNKVLLIVLLMGVTVTSNAARVKAQSNANQYDIREQASFLVTDENNTPILDVLDKEAQPSLTPNKDIKKHGSLDYNNPDTNLGSSK